jgi:hypothetical protein
MATPANGWTDYALLTPSKGGKPYKVQVNAEGRFRCSCPAFIFCKGVKTCKHCRKCEDTRGLEQKGQAAVATLPVAKPWNPFAEEATKACTAMLTAARLVPTEAQTAQMVEVLTARLRLFGGRPSMVTEAAPVQAQTVVVGIRRITFDD